MAKKPRPRKPARRAPGQDPGRPQVRGAAGANKIVVGDRRGRRRDHRRRRRRRSWSQSKQERGHRHAAPRCPPVRAMGEGFPAFADATPASGAPTLDLYEDFQCPVCEQFEAHRLTITEPRRPGQAQARLPRHELPRRQDRRQTLHPGGQRCVLRRGRRQVPGVPRHGLRQPGLRRGAGRHRRAS